MFFQRKKRTGTLVGYAKLCASSEAIEETSLVTAFGSDPMIRLLLNTCCRLSDSRIVLERITRADFNIPRALWKCEAGYVGLVYLQDDESRDNHEATILISGRANGKSCTQSILNIQKWIASFLEENRPVLGIEEITWK